ncbi:MAG: hypothetical protein KJ767_03460 [Nanoarchaeota archaeon]|nr:hypothetical protein [Nanoarchaeota archaeon]
MEKNLVDRLKEARQGDLLGSKELKAIAKVESAVLRGFRNYCESEGFEELIVPHMTAATGACENFLTVFPVEYFGKTAYLSQTGQLYLEAFVPSMRKVCCAGSSFRKEPDVDNRHLVEFPLLEIEEADITLDVLKDRISGIVNSMITSVGERCGSELSLLDIDSKWLGHLTPPYNSITYGKAIETLNKYDYDLKWGNDLKSKHEHKLIEINEGMPLFVTHYPQEIKFFNMRQNRDNPLIVNSADFLFPYGGEAVGAAEREEDYSILEKRLYESKMLELMCEAIKQEPGEFANKPIRELKEEGINRFRWYLDLVKQSPVRHAGCGIGMNRIVQGILKCPDIRASTIYPLNRKTLM